MIPKFDLNDTEAALKLIEDLTTNARGIQESVLEEILTQNADTEYLRGFLDGKSDKQSFKKRVPVVSYEDIKPYVERIMAGEPSDIICSQPITNILISTGTSGRAAKMLPSTAEDVERRGSLGKLLVAIINKNFDGMEHGKGMMFMFVKSETKTPSGLFATSVASRSFKKRSNLNRPLNWYNSYTSPPDIIMCPDNKQSMYCQLLCGLLQRDDVLRVGANFAYTFIRLIKFLEEYWRELCSDIRRGHVSDWITDTNSRTSIHSILTGPNPELADVIEHECCQNSWEGIIRKLWPRTKFIQTVVSGSMAQYVPMLEFYSGGLPIVSSIYGSSEGRFGINLEPLSKPSNVLYTLLPFLAYFEFLPVDEIEMTSTDKCCLKNIEDQLVDLAEVKVGQSYELVVTTYSGLYRYRMGDILMVTSFHNNTPKFKFSQRQGAVLSIDVDKTSEDDLFKAVTRAKQRLEPLGLMLIDYTSYSDLSSFPGHYVLFWELVQKYSNDALELDPLTIEDCCFEMEESFHYTYRSCRRNKYKSIGPLEIRVVKMGTFDLLMDFFISRGSSINQYKTPRCIRSAEAFELLDSRVIAKFFSQKTPSWVSSEGIIPHGDVVQQ